MNEETYETLKRVLIASKAMLTQKYAGRKRLTQDEVWHKATLIRDITDIENWVDEVANEYPE